MHAEIPLSVDLVQPTVNIDFTNSRHVSGFNTSNASLIEFDLQNDNQALATKLVLTSSLTASCQPLSTQQLARLEALGIMFST